MTLKIMSFNIRGSCKDDGVNIWANRAPLNIKTLQKYNPDIIAFQELQQGNLETYQRELNDYQYFLGLPYNRPGRELYNAIFWKLEQFILRSQGSFYLSETPEVWSASWDTARVRTANWVLLEHVKNQQIFFCFNTHLDHESILARQQGIKLILQQIVILNNNNLPVILTGDFNSYLQLPQAGETLTSQDGVYETIGQAGFIDSYLVAGNKDRAGQHSVHNFLGAEYRVENSDLVHRIDWIWLQENQGKFAVKQCQILKDSEPPVYPSDHYPILAEVALLSKAGTRGGKSRLHPL
ncbi:endonuclease/exonuclease/phosphatase family protein [Spirulina subsalsa]|uniref:endonuclease/exonuclease/phosphatase family protein n=1 Tax=Spirulina subsalsa TaxID=54311 RepID=UPI00031F3CB7|nr:endonuclease/exonuclease/phosphatase family protein [Spirulina subsalsa]